MKLAVVNSASPFISGGAEHLAASLAGKLREYGHEAALINVYFPESPPDAIPRSILAARLMRIPCATRIVCLRFPAFHIPHPDKVLWILHQYRSAYELWDTDYGSLPVDETGRRIREIVRNADNEFFPESCRIYTSHEVTARRLQSFNGIFAEPLLCPHGDTSRFHCEEYGDTIVAFGRLDWIKRQHLAVEAMAYTRTGVRLHVAGSSNDERLIAHIRHVIRTKHLEEKVCFEPRFISEEEKAGALARTLAAVNIPFEEDSHGYVTIEAGFSRKACVACSDSGGVLSAVQHGLTGYVAEPDPRALAEAFDRLFSDREGARRMGENAWLYARDLPDSWDLVISKLTS